jgi:hypothetical protein
MRAQWRNARFYIGQRLMDLDSPLVKAGGVEDPAGDGLGFALVRRGERHGRGDGEERNGGEFHE